MKKETLAAGLLVCVLAIACGGQNNKSEIASFHADLGSCTTTTSLKSLGSGYQKTCTEYSISGNFSKDPTEAKKKLVTAYCLSLGNPDTSIHYSDVKCDRTEAKGYCAFQTSTEKEDLLIGIKKLQIYISDPMGFSPDKCKGEKGLYSLYAP